MNRLNYKRILDFCTGKYMVQRFWQQLQLAFPSLLSSVKFRSTISWPIFNDHLSSANSVLSVQVKEFRKSVIMSIWWLLWYKNV